MNPQSPNFSPAEKAIFPRSVLSVSREEFGFPEDNPDAIAPPLKLIVEGTVPPDIQGHVFIVGPVGSVDSRDANGQTGHSVVVPCQDGTTLLYNGDGMIYRLDFDNLQDGVSLSTRIVKPPCYYADVATNRCPQYQQPQDLRFTNWGITRLSGPLGARNQLNTAFLPMKFVGDDRERLLVTWDAGRPYEIDPHTLEAVTPVGGNDEWKEVSSLSQLPFTPPKPFKIIQGSAHPGFDPYKNGGEIVTVNCGRSLSNLLSQLIPVAYLFKELWNSIIQGFYKTDDRTTGNSINLAETRSERETPRHLPEAKSWEEKLLNILRLIIQFFKALVEIFFGNFVDLMVWNGEGKLKKWQVCYKGLPISIQQSTHQIAITEDYIVIVDTAFKVALEELLPPLTERSDRDIEQVIQNFFDEPQLPDNYVYIIRRSDLKPENKVVSAKRTIISQESAHFLANYKNPSGQITLHFSHVCAWDAAECISEFDFNSPTDKASETLQRLYGVLFGPMDISRLGCYVIDAENAECLRKDSLLDVDYTWGPAIYTYRNGTDYSLPDQLTDIYWGCLGCWEELLMPHIVNLYKDYKYRQAGVELIEDIAKKNNRSILLRVHIAPLDSVKAEENRLQIPDAYEFPEGFYITSPQFVPSSERSGSTDGYVVCIVHYGDGNDGDENKKTNGNEIWIFDATNLQSGPICKLSHPQLNLGFTVHSTWLQKAMPRTAAYNIPVEDDYRQLVEKQPQIVRDLFENWVYKKKEPPVD